MVHEVRAIVRTIATRMEGGRISRLDRLLAEKQEQSEGKEIRAGGNGRVSEVKRGLTTSDRGEEPARKVRKINGHPPEEKGEVGKGIGRRN